MLKSLKWLLLCLIIFGVFISMSFDKNDTKPSIANQVVKIIPEVVKSIEPTSSSLEPDITKKPEKKIIINRDNNNNKIISYDSRTSNLQNLNNIYKWRDSKRTLIISSEPPPANVIYETFHFDQSGTVPSALNEANIKPNREFRILLSTSDNPLRVYTPDGLRELIKQSKEVGEKLELRGELLDELTEML